MPHRTLPAVLVAVALLAAPPSFSQSASPPQAFTTALGSVSASLEGRFADDGGRVLAGLNAMEKALAAWDETIGRSQSTLAAELAKALQPETAIRLRVTMAMTLAERGRTTDAAAQLTDALTISPTALRPADVDAHTVLGLIHSQLTGNRTAAASAFRAAVAAAPGAPLQRYLLAKHLADDGATEEAAAVGREIRQDTRRADDPDRAPFLRLHLIPETEGIEPYFSLARYAKAFAAFAAGDYGAGVTELRSTVASDPLLAAPNAARVFLDEAGAAFRDGDTAGTRAAIERAQQTAPTWSETHRLRGVVLVADDRIEEGMAAFAETLRLSPADERAHLAHVDALVQLERWEDAHAALDTAMAAVPDSARLHHVRGRLQQRQGLYPEALSAFERALAVQPALPLLGKNTLFATIATLRRAQQEFPLAAAAFSKRVDLVPNSVAAHRDLGDVYFRQGLNDLAWTELAIAEALSPRDVGTQAALALLHLRAGRHAETIGAARRAIALDATHAQSHYVLGTALVRADQANEGAAALATFERLQSAEAETRQRDLELSALRREASVASGQGDHTGAVERLGRIVEKEPQGAIAHLELGVALLAAGRAADAVERLQQAAGLGASGDVYRHLARAYTALGQAAESQRADEAYGRIRREQLRRAGRQ